MSLAMDPEGVETRALHELVDFGDRDVLEVGCGDGQAYGNPEPLKAIAFTFRSTR
jgi:hypothetical protein